MKILVTPINAVGHINACAGALASLLRRGHRIIFIIEEAFKGKLSSLGYEEVLYQIPKEADEQNPGEGLSKQLFEMKMFGDFTIEEKFDCLLKTFLSEKFLAEFEIFNGKIKESTEKIKPDLIW